MSNEDRELLLKDLCARLPYGVKVQVFIHEEDESSKEILTLNGFQGESQYVLWIYDKEKLAKYGCSGRGFHVEEVKPYLRSMRSMTKEEKVVYNDFNLILVGYTSRGLECADLFDWLNAHHFDYRGLIEQGLAIEVTKDNNPY